MAKPFDATLNQLIDARPDDWVRFLAPRAGLVPGPAEVIDTDLSTTVQADKVFRVAGPEPFLLHLELESNPRLGVPKDLLRYNVLLAHVHDLPVHSVLLTLRPKANATDQTGHYRRAGLEFWYTVIRVWNEPAEMFLTGGPTLAPLAMLTDEAAQDLVTAFSRFSERLRRLDVSSTLKNELLVANLVLSGLRYEEERVAELYRSLSMLLEDSTTYQAIIRKGAAQGMAQGVAEGIARGTNDEARRILMIQGRKRFGSVPGDVEVVLYQIADTERLERMAERILDATGWDDLLATP